MGCCFFEKAVLSVLIITSLTILLLLLTIGLLVFQKLKLNEVDSRTNSALITTIVVIGLIMLFALVSIVQYRDYQKILFIVILILSAMIYAVIAALLITMQSKILDKFGQLWSNNLTQSTDEIESMLQCQGFSENNETITTNSMEAILPSCQAVLKNLFILYAKRVGYTLIGVSLFFIIGSIISIILICKNWGRPRIYTPPIHVGHDELDGIGAPINVTSGTFL